MDTADPPDLAGKSAVFFSKNLRSRLSTRSEASPGRFSSDVPPNHTIVCAGRHVFKP